MIKKFTGFTGFILGFAGLFLFAIGATAQQCGMEGKNVFVLNINSNGKPVKGLKVYLVDEAGAPYLYEKPQSSKSNKTYKAAWDTLFFYENANFNKHKHPERVFFKAAGDNYVVIFNEINEDKKKNHLLKGYQALIVDVDGKANGGDFGKHLVRLKYRNSVNICYTHFLTSEPNNPPDPPRIKDVGGQYFTPININLSEPIVNVDSTQIGFMFNYHYDTLRNTKGFDSLYGISSITIRRQYDFKVVQKIDFPGKAWVGETLLKTMVEFEDFYKNHPEPIEDFRILNSYKVENNTLILRHWYYVYNPKTDLYTLDTFLSAYPNIIINHYTGNLSYKLTEVVSNGIYQDTYTLEAGKWVRMRQFTPNPQTVERTAPADPNSLELLVHEVKWLAPGNKKVSIRQFKTYGLQAVADTFWFVNTSGESLNLKNMSPAKVKGLTYSERVRANDTGFIAISELVYIYPTMLETKTLVSNPFPELVLESAIFILGSEVNERMLDGLRQKWVYNSTDSIFIKTLSFYPDGKPKAFGIMAIGDTTLYGTWLHCDTNGVLKGQIYSKKLHLMAYGNSKMDYQKCKVKAKVNGKWISMNSRYINSTNVIYVLPQTDSITVKNSFGSNHLKITNFQNYANENYTYVYLVKPNQFSINIGGAETPITFINDQYRIEPDMRYIQQHWKNGFTQEAFIKWFNSNYPGLQSIQLYLFDQEIIIDLSLKSVAEKSRLLAQLVNQPEIYSISQLIEFPEGTTTFAYRSGSFLLDYNLSNDRAKQLIESAGFTYTGSMAYSGAHHQFIYKKKLLDKQFYTVFNKTCTLPDVVSGNLNFYSRASLDKMDE